MLLLTFSFIFISDIHHYHTFSDHPFHFSYHDAFHDIETTTKKSKEKDEEFPHFIHYHYEREIPYKGKYHEHEYKITEKPDSKEKDIYFYSNHRPEDEIPVDFIEKIVTTTEKAVPHIFFDSHDDHKSHYYTDIFPPMKKEKTTKKPKLSDYFPPYFIDDEDADTENLDHIKYKRDLKHIYFLGVHHKHEFLHNHGEKVETTTKKEELSGICMFCKNKCGYPKSDE